MPYNFAGQLQNGQPVTSFIAARDNAAKNALFQQQAADQQATSEANRQNLLFQQQRQTAADTVASQERDKVTSQDEGKQIHSAMQALGAVAGDPVKFQGLSQRILNHPSLGPILAKHGVTQEDMTPANVQELLAASGAEIGQGPADQFEQVNGPRGSIIKKNTRTGDLAQVVGPDNTETPNYGQPRAPAGYQFTPDRTLAPIPGGPADPSAVTTKDNTRTFQKADKLRDEFNTLSKEFISVGDSYNIVREVAKVPSAAGDLSMIFAYMKMLDPNSVVREQEFANAQNAAGIPERVRNAYNKALNGERLNPTQRQDFISQAKNLFSAKKQRQDSVTKRYTDIAKRNGVNPDDVVGDLNVSMEAPGASPAQRSPVSVASPAEAVKLPAGTHFVTPDGQVRVKR